MEYLWDHRCERTNMAYKYKMFEAVCTVSKVIGINTENKLRSKEYMSLLMIKNKYGCQMHSIYSYNCWAKSLLTYFYYAQQ